MSVQYMAVIFKFELKILEEISKEGRGEGSKGNNVSYKRYLSFELTRIDTNQLP